VQLRIAVPDSRGVSATCSQACIGGKNPPGKAKVQSENFARDRINVDFFDWLTHRASGVNV